MFLQKVADVIETKITLYRTALDTVSWHLCGNNELFIYTHGVGKIIDSGYQ